MKLNTRVRYSVRMMADIMKHGGEGTVPLKDAARRQNLSKRYLSQLATTLKNAGLLKSVWGMNGGYMLARPGSKITILEIVEAVEGPISIIECVMDEEHCMRGDFCECKGLWNDVNSAIRDKLAACTLEELLNYSGKGRKNQ